MISIVLAQSLGDDIQVDFDNGSTLLIPVKRLLELTGFDGLEEDDRILYPHYDSKSVFWRFGPCLTVEELLNMLEE